VNEFGFTGRYHDGETGLIYFRARYMSTTLGRFTGRDPVRNVENVNGVGIYNWFVIPEFTGGAIPQAFSAYRNAVMYSGDPIGDDDRVQAYGFSANSVDPTGLNPTITISTVAGPAPGKCRGFVWDVNFTLSQPSPRGGYFVQEIQWAGTATDCAGTSIAPKCVNTRHFWEAWKVLANGTQDELVAAGQFTYADRYSGARCDICTKGTASVTGSLSFYEGLTLPAAFIANNPATNAGDLLSTGQNPNLGGGTAAIAHNISITWDCCPRDERDTVIVSHTP